jgi:hypothetical protein
MKIADNPYYIGSFPNDDVRLKNTAGEQCDLRILLPNGHEVLNTNGVFINRCPDKEFLAELKEVLIPKQKELANKLGFPD